MTATALVVDDEVDLCRLMQITLTKMGIKSDIAYDLSAARDYLKNNTYDFCLTDLRLPDGSGLELVQEISRQSNTPVAVITAHGSMDLAIQALKLGAFDFVNKPLELPRLRQLIENAMKVAQQVQDNPDTTQKSAEQQLLDERLIGDSAAMKKLKSTIVKLARSQAPVFLWGASGTGKEVVARLIHDLSPRKEGSFVPVNCGAIPSELMESEFFGHKKGSFTGATTDKQGLFQQASGGTLFLDEVADLPLAMQVKLLRAIQEKTVRAIGDTKEVPVDIRILSATHKDLSKLVQTGAFRQDLFYRINVIELKLPTLNERSSDIPALAHHFLNLIAKDWQLEESLELTQAACQCLQKHDFEGNVRELRNILERAVTLAETSNIDVQHLGIDPTHNTLTPSHDIADEYSYDDDDDIQTLHIRTEQAESSLSSHQPSTLPTHTTTINAHPYRTTGNPYATVIQQTNKSSTDDNVDNTSAYEPRQNRRHTDRPNDINGNHQHSNESPNYHNNEKYEKPTDDVLPEEGLEAYLQEQEKMLIITALNQTEWNKTQAAKLLGTTFRSLRYRMKKLDIDEDQYSGEAED